MSIFEEKGVERQHKARTKTYAINSFQQSCNICCYTGKHINCDNCAIANAHSEVIKSLSDRIPVLA